MKHLIVILTAVSLLLSSCSQALFQQIATLSSDNVELKPDGSFAYEDAVVTISYDFWSESGKFTFIVTNNTDDNIYLNLGESYYINNGYAYDYYQARTYVYAGGSTASSLAAVPVMGFAVASAVVPDKSVEYAEQPIVCIPAHSSKTFEEFNVSTSVFRECGFVRNPSRKEISVREFSISDSPRVIENRLVFQLGDISLPVVNVFYVSKYQNISYGNATKYVNVADCDGTIRSIKVNTMSADNRFYVTYDSNDVTYDSNDFMSVSGDSDDRLSGSASGFAEGLFYDGVYR